jgi:hypothetical protein
LDIRHPDESIYLVRVVDAYRGGSLGNPYLAEHQDAVKFMPEIAERILAAVARATGVQPLAMVCVARIVFPLLIYLVLLSLAGGLGRRARMSTLAAVIPPLMSRVLFWKYRPGEDPGFLRYVRAVSPVLYVLLLVVTLHLVFIAWQQA